MGRKIELMHLDPQGDNARYQEFVRRVLQRDKVDVLIGGFTSASREASARSSTGRRFYFYNNQYEGGVCDASMVVIGAVPEQQFSTLIPWMMEKFGKKVYTIAADYNFGQISAEWMRDLVKQNGGEMVGEEFIPLGVSQFCQTIQNIQRAKPDWLMMLNVGAAQDSFFEQAAAAKLNLPMASPIKVMLGYEHKRFQPPACTTCTRSPTGSRRSTRRPPRTSRSAGTPSSPTRPTSTTWATTPTSRSTCTSRWWRRPSRPSRPSSAQVDCHRQRLHRFAGRQDLHRSQEPAYLPHDADDRRQCRPLGEGDQGFGEIKPYWLGEVGCDLTKADPKEQYAPIESAEEK